MFGQRIMGIGGVKNHKRKGCVALPIDFLCKIEISKFMASSNQENRLEYYTNK